MRRAIASLRDLLRLRTAATGPAAPDGAMPAHAGSLRKASAELVARRVDALLSQAPSAGLVPVVAHEMAQDFAHRVLRRMDELGLPADATLAQALHRCRAPLESRFGRAVREHLEALRMVEADPRLTPAQRPLLREFARHRRIDPVQVREIEAVARRFKPLLARLAHHVENQACEQALDSLARMQGAFARAHARAAAHAEGMWIAHVLHEPAARAQRFRLCVDLAIADAYDDAALAHGMLVRLGALCAAADDMPATLPRSPRAAARGIAPAGALAAAPLLCELELAYVDIVLAFARRAGFGLDEIAHLRGAARRRAG